MRCEIMVDLRRYSEGGRCEKTHNTKLATVNGKRAIVCPHHLAVAQRGGLLVLAK